MHIQAGEKQEIHCDIKRFGRKRDFRENKPELLKKYMVVIKYQETNSREKGVAYALLSPEIKKEEPG